MKFRKKPVVIEAVQWFKDGDHPEVKPVFKHGPNDEHWAPTVPTGLGWIKTLEGEMTVSPGDWIITGVKGEHYPCKPDIFEATYGPADELAQPEQEPVAWMFEFYVDRGFSRLDFEPQPSADNIPLYTAPPSIEAAVLAEREACAKIVDEWNTAITDKISAEIRARGEK